MKRNPILDTIPKIEIDQTAVSITDIVNDRGITRPRAAEIRDMNLATGAWEEVFKHQSGKIVKAYRGATKKRKR